MFIDLLNEGGVDVNKEYPEEGNNTLLLLSVQRDSLEFAKELLSLASCDPNTTNRRSRVAALHLAVTQGNPDMVRLLLRSGASVNIKKEDGTHPCLRAVAAVLTKHAAEPKWEGEDSKAGGRPRALTVRQAKELVDLVLTERGKVKVTRPYCRRRLPFLREVWLAHINCAAPCLCEGPFVSGLSLVKAYSLAFACSMAFIIWPGVSGHSQAGVTASWLGVAASPKEDGGAEGLGAQAHCLLQVVAEACPCRSASLQCTVIRITYMKKKCRN